MRGGIIFAAAVSVLAATSAHAEAWCGYATRAKAMIECGYSSVAECETAIGKGGMCFVDPDYAVNAKRPAPVVPHPEAAAKRPSKGDGPSASAASSEARGVYYRAGPFGAAPSAHTSG
jgi:hypothetical protein